MEMRLPQVEKIVTETIDGKEVQKQIYADGSYGIRNGDEIKRYFPDGKEQIYKYTRRGFTIISEELPDGTERKWDEYGKKISEKLPDGTEIRYDKRGKVTYHATKGKEDTVIYLAEQRVLEKMEKNKEKLIKAPKVVQKIASSKAFNDIALKVAKKKIKKSRGE